MKLFPFLQGDSNENFPYKFAAKLRDNLEDLGVPVVLYPIRGIIRHSFPPLIRN